MTPIAGGSALSLSFGFSLLTVLTLLIYTRNQDQRLFLVGQRLALCVSFFIFLATFILSYQLIISNFDIDYVARYTSIETPTIYKISALNRRVYNYAYDELAPKEFFLSISFGSEKVSL